MGPLRRRARLSARDERGSAALEFAFIVPVLCVLLFGIVSYGMMLSFRQSMSQAATEGARAAAVTLDTSQKKTAGYASVNDALDSFSVSCAGGTLTRSGKNVGTCTVTDPGPCSPAAAGATCVTVTIEYRYKDNPIVPSFPGVGVLIPEKLKYSAQARVS